MRNTSEILLDKSDKHDKAILKVQSELLRFNDVDKLIRGNATRIEENAKNFSEYQAYSSKKFSDIDNNILNFIQTMNEINEQLEKKGNGNVNLSNINLASQANQESTQVQMQAEISKSVKEITNLKKIFREFNEKFDKIANLSTSLEDQLNVIKKESSNAGKSNIANASGKGSDKESLGEDNIANANDNELQNETNSNKTNIEMLFDRMKKFQEYFKTVTTNLGQKTEKSDFEKLTRLVNAEFEKTNKKVSESESKIKSFTAGAGGAGGKNTENSELADSTENIGVSGGKSGKGGKASQKQKTSVNLSNGFEFDEGIINMTKALIESELQSKNEFTKMLEFMEEFRAKSDSSKADIDKLFESVVEIRNGLSLGALLEEKLYSVQDQLHEHDSALKKQKREVEERFKNLEGEPILEETNINSENTATGTGSIKDNIKTLNSIFKQLSDKVEKVVLRQDSMNSEILTKVKKDLSTESAKILNEFKGDLKISITRIEDQLLEKVDKFSLDEFGKGVNLKLSNEMNKKLDRSDLKRNNNLINKKIDTLENKISKTLVDTLIDLQMEEAPLIVKKPLGAQAREKCASCNQVVLNSIINEEGFYESDIANGTSYYGSGQNSKQHNMTVMPQKFKFKGVQESCYKFGAGSYSRFLSSIDNVNDDLRYNKSVQLPEIINSNKANNTRKIPVGGPNAGSVNTINNHVNNETKLKNKILEEFTDKAFSSMINEELEKKIINPDNLIKTANKLYETVEKEKRNIVNSSNLLNNK